MDGGQGVRADGRARWSARRSASPPRSLLCWLLYRRAVRLNVGVFFNRTAIALIVIAAGVLAYGLGDLQDAGWLPGHAWIAFDLTAHIDPGSWWASIITGVTELSPKMTVLQVTAWLAYLAVVIPAFVNAGRAGREDTRPSPLPPPPTPSPPPARPPRRPSRGRARARPVGADRRRPPVAGGRRPRRGARARGRARRSPRCPPRPSSAASTVTVTRTDVRARVDVRRDPGTQTITVTNDSGLAGEISLDNAAGAIIGEIETIGPGTSAPLTATLGSRHLHLQVPDGLAGGHRPRSRSRCPRAPGRRVTDPGRRQARHRRRADPAEQALPGLRGRAAHRPGRGHRGHRGRPAARRPGAGQAGLADRPARLGAGRRVLQQLRRPRPRGRRAARRPAERRQRQGLHRPAPPGVRPVARPARQRAAARRRRARPERGRGQEEPDLRRPGRRPDPACRCARTRSSRTRCATTCRPIDDEGAGAAYAMTYADTQVDQAVLGYLSGLIGQREPGLVATADSELAALDAALLATKAERPVAVADRGQPRQARSTSTRPSARCSRRWPPFPTSSKSRPRTRPQAYERHPAHRPNRQPTAPGANPVDLSRRNFLKGTATGAAGTALAGGVLIGGAHADADAATRSDPVDGGVVPVPRRDPVRRAHPGTRRQAGVHLRRGLRLARRRTRRAWPTCCRRSPTRARFLTAGGTPPDLGVSQPPSDSDVLGPVVPADGLTVTLSAGSTLFDDRYGLAARKPLKLTPMTTFPNDSPEPTPGCTATCSLQLCANHPDTIHHAMRDITKHTRGGMQLRWKIEGYNSPPRPSGHRAEPARVQGRHRQPDRDASPSHLVWVDDPAEPAWAQGGSYQVVRLIRMLVEFWDRVSINEQEGMFGRRRDTGAPLDGTSEFDTPNYQADPHGTVIPLDSHIRLANPRTAADREPAAPPPLLQLRPRRGRERQPAGRATSSSPTSRTSSGSSRPCSSAPGRRAADRLRAAVRRRLLLHPARRPRRQRLVRQGPARLTAAGAAAGRAGSSAGGHSGSSPTSATSSSSWPD